MTNNSRHSPTATPRQPRTTTFKTPFHPPSPPPPWNNDGKRCEGLSLFGGRNIRPHKQHLPQRVTAGGRLRQCQVPTMDGIEAAAEKPDIHSDFFLLLSR